ncbi:hypothetical protein [Actinomadura hibisca]|uniref:hypothetical protein n=1 Tax=Actinomadura hibisca TaxID=68565 RepID=UPI000833B09C|nr:hypothetical protein [Actinomadura hibisca]
MTAPKGGRRAVRSLGTALTAGAAALALAAAPAATASAAAPARAAAPLPPEVNFDDCPKIPDGAPPEYWLCTVVVIHGGTLQLGKIDQKIIAPMKLTYATGYDPETFEPKLISGPLKGAPVKVDGGVLGIPGSDFLPLLQIHAQPQLAGDFEFVPPDSPGTIYRLKLKIKTINPLLGDTCYIGTDAKPLTLNLTWGTTNPPPPNKPISGVVAEPLPDNPMVLGGRLVDNAFAVPKSSGCGPFGLLNPIADFRAGLPAKAGTNTAIFDFYSTNQGYTGQALNKSQVAAFKAKAKAAAKAAKAKRK